MRVSRIYIVDVARGVAASSVGMVCGDDPRVEV